MDRLLDIRLPTRPAKLIYSVRSQNEVVYTHETNSKWEHELYCQSHCDIFVTLPILDLFCAVFKKLYYWCWRSWSFTDELLWRSAQVATSGHLPWRLRVIEMSTRNVKGIRKFGALEEAVTRTISIPAHEDLHQWRHDEELRTWCSCLTIVYEESYSFRWTKSEYVKCGMLVVRQTEIVTSPYWHNAHSRRLVTEKLSPKLNWATWVILLPWKHCNVVILWTRNPKITYEVLIYNPLNLSRNFDQRLSRHILRLKGK